MKTLTKISIIILLALLSFNSDAQDVNYTQGFYSNPLKLNPAYMGMNNDLKFILNYKTQWSGIGKGFKTSSFTTLFPLFLKGNEHKIDLGLNVINDKFGAFSNTDVGVALGYKLKTSKSGYISFSVMGDYVQKSLNTKTLTFDDQYVLGDFSPSNVSNTNISNKNTSFFDLNAGLMWYFNEEGSKLNGYLGFSGYHLTSVNETYLNGSGNLPKMYSIQMGVKIKGGDSTKLDFTPNLRYFNQANNQTLAIGSYVDYHLNKKTNIKLGIWYRSNNAISAMLGLEISKFVVSYSYDVASKNMSTYVRGLNTHEITLVFKINQAKRKGVESPPSIY